MKKIGEFIVYKRDVCEMVDIKEKYLRDIDYYILSPVLDKSLRIQVPVNSTLFRELVSSHDVEKLISKISCIPIIEVDEKFLEAEYKKLLYHEIAVILGMSLEDTKNYIIENLS